MTNRISNPDQVAPPAATANAGGRFEARVGGFYLLSLLAAGEPRGLPGATVERVRFQQAVDGFPFDDVVVEARSADGSPATLELQAKRTLDFTASDKEFADVVRRLLRIAQKPEFASERYEVAVALARTSTRIERFCQEVLHWARQLPSGQEFSSHIAREGFASKGMRDFVAAFSKHLAATGGPTDDDTVWRLLRHFQILVFDFEAVGSDYDLRARERCRMVLAPEQAGRAGDLWPILAAEAETLATAAGSVDRVALADQLQRRDGFVFGPRADLKAVCARLVESSQHALDDIKEHVGGVRLSREELVDQAHQLLEGHKIVRVVGEGGVGKSHVLKSLALRLAVQGTVLVVAPSRVLPGGWVQMASAIGCPVTRDELLNELACGGGARLFIDGIDKITEVGAWATVIDLMRGAMVNAGWRVVVTARAGDTDWVNRLSPDMRDAMRTLHVDEITDDETAVLASGNRALAILLDPSHLARGVARNLFYLSRMVDLVTGHDQVVAGIASEIDLARIWWRYGGGRSDDRRLERLKALREIGRHAIEHPEQAAFRIDTFGDVSTVSELLALDSLREDRPGSTVTFRHDVLRDWSVGFLLDEEAEQLGKLELAQPIPTGLARGLEIAARLALEADPTGSRWVALLARVERDDCHGSWRRPVLLALPRSEQALKLLEQLHSILLEHGGKRLGEIIRLMLSVEAEPLAKRIAGLGQDIAVPQGLGSLAVPKGFGWQFLVIWLAASAERIPSALIPDAAKLFQLWLISMHAHATSRSLNMIIMGILCDWLMRIEGAMYSREITATEHEPGLSFPHMRETRDDIRTAFLALCHLTPELAEQYLASLDPEIVRHDDLKHILSATGRLAKAAPRALVDFTLAAFIEKDDPDDLYSGRSNRFGPFGVHELQFLLRSPGQGPFFEVLESSPPEGLRLVRGIVEHATDWQLDVRRQQPFPKMVVPFPRDEKTFRGNFGTYHWTRGGALSAITTSALMALEAWGHRQIESGRPFNDVMHDVLGPSGSSVAFVAVAVDLALSHWDRASASVWPLVAVPELLCYDNARYIRDITGVDSVMGQEPEPGYWRIKRADIDSRSSRSSRLSDCIGWYLFANNPERLAALRGALVAARDRIIQQPDVGDNLNGFHATAQRAVRMCEESNWPLVKVRGPDGLEIEARQFERDPAEEARLAEARTQSDLEMRRQNTRIATQQALFSPSKSIAEVVADAVAWAKQQLIQRDAPAVEDEEDDDDREFDAEWDRRAVVMSAALAVRDYSGDDKVEVLAWARSILDATIAQPDKRYSGNDQVVYHAKAIAALGLTLLFAKDDSAEVRNILLKLAAHSHPAVLNAIGKSFRELSTVNGRFVRSIVRVVMTSVVLSRRTDDDALTASNKEADAARVAATIEAEIAWLDGTGTEPTWPLLPAWITRRRRAIRIGQWVEVDEEDEAIPEYYVDEHRLGQLAGHLIPLTVRSMPDWLRSLASHWMDWTCEANGASVEDDHDRDNRPTTWNVQFFDFAGVLTVALPHDQVVDLLLRPIMSLKGEAFHDAAAGFLRGFDRATFATDTKTPDNPVGIRAMFADRVRQGYGFKRLGREKSSRSETHLGDVLRALFYQPSVWALVGTPSVPAKWNGLAEVMPTLTRIVEDAPASGYLAIAFMNLIESHPCAQLVPFMTHALAAWCAAYGVDAHFWSDTAIGARACEWLNAALGKDESSAAAVNQSGNDLLRCLDVLIRSGISQAQDVEKRIRELQAYRKSACSFAPT